MAYEFACSSFDFGSPGPLYEVSSVERIVMKLSCLVLLISTGLVAGGLWVNAGAPPAQAGRAALLAEMGRRPADPWPRGTGHVVLGMPGLPEDWKAYHEPGGGFSPAFASFGISFWVVDKQGRLLTTSDAIAMTELTQRWVWSTARSWPPLPDLPGLETKTPHYTCTWEVLGPARYRLRMRTGSANAVWIMVRRPGPAGGVIDALNWAGGQLYVNNRWILGITGPGPQVDLAGPGDADGGVAGSQAPFWPAERAWGYARIQLLPAQEYALVVEPIQRPPDIPLPDTPGRSALRLDMPDARFVESLDAQIAHVAMGLVSNETRPGDPNHYPLNWLSDGAYSIVALAHAGRLDTARELCRPIAESDFFGGFGAEADAPGLALWAMEGVAVRADDAAFEDWIWQHVPRKVALIQRMLTATGPMRQPFVGPVVPAHANKPELNLVCDAARDGLIVGRVDWQRPVLYVNAVSYRGLMSAANLAQRRGFRDQSTAWLAQAQSLGVAWNRALTGPEAGNELSAICGLHPTWVVKDRAAYREVLGRHRAKTQDAAGWLAGASSRTAFQVAGAHQALLLGQPDEAWDDLEWFWRHQASPGLYTWWEGRGEDNTFGRWERAMGWVREAQVTPDYRTASEMALLQLAMLVTVDRSGDHPRLLIGAGVPPAWVGHRLRVEGVLTSVGPVDWEWRRGRLTVRHRGASVNVVPGPAFPRNLELRVRD